MLPLSNALIGLFCVDGRYSCESFMQTQSYFNPNIQIQVVSLLVKEKIPNIRVIRQFFFFLLKGSEVRCLLLDALRVNDGGSLTAAAFYILFLSVVNACF